MGLLALKAHSSNAAVSDVIPVSGPISFDISHHAKNYGLRQSIQVNKHTRAHTHSGSAGGHREYINEATVQFWILPSLLIAYNW